MKHELYILRRDHKYCENCGKPMILKDVERRDCTKNFDPRTGNPVPSTYSYVWLCPSMGAGNCDLSYFEVE